MSKELEDELNAAGNDVTALSNLVRKMITQVGQLSDKIEGLNSELGGTAKLIGQNGELFGSILTSVTSFGKSIQAFSKNLAGQYKLSEELAKSYKQTSISIGIGYQNQKLLSEEFNRSVYLVQQLGGTVEDVEGIYSRFSEESGRVRILDDEEVSRIFQINKATGLARENATRLAERFDLMGVGSKVFAENINDIVVDAQKLGLNSSKVVKVLSDNFESMQRMSFRGGVNAMGEMSKLAVKMRMDVSDMLGMADKFYEPEAAIEAAANLQLLGGKMASTFGDPMQMMFDARNAPEEFAKKVGDATEGMVQFNEKTGKFDMIAENRQRLMGMAEALGINKDQLIDTAYQMNKMKKIKMDVGGNLFDEDTMDKIASIAKFDKDSGSWTVDVKGEDIAVEDLNADQIEAALAAPTDEKTAIIETAKASMTTNQHLMALETSTKTLIALQTDFYSKIETQMATPLDDLKDISGGIVDSIAAGLKNVDLNANISESITTGFNALGSASSLAAGAVQQFTAGVNKNLTKLNEIRAKIVSTDNSPIVKDGYFPAQGGSKGPTISTTFGGLYQIDPRDAIAVGPPSAIPTPNTNMEQKYISNSTSPATNSNISMGGNITMTVKIDAPSGVDTKIVEKAVNKAFTTNRLEELVTGKVSGKDNVYSNTF